ncbi:MAG TPA: helix-turn-helix domain-containing protein [Clostridia bacterium]|nr:helix-turn-helix domain-containing protein [Clostridia bacterium]
MLQRKSPFIRNYYVKLLLSFILMSTVIIISISIVFSNIYTDSVYNQLKVEYINGLDRINVNLDNLVNQLEQANIYLRQNAEIISFLTSTEYDWQTVNRAYNYLMATKQMNTYIRSIYLYNKNFNDYLHTGLSDISIDEIISDNSHKVASRSRFHMVFSTINFNPASGTKPVSTISFVFKDSPITSAKPENAVIINLDRQAIEKDILSKFDGITIVIDAHGKLIFNPLNYPLSGSPVIESYFKKILEDGEIKGSLNFKSRDGNKIVTYIKSLETDCYLINIISVNDIASIISKKRNTIILISLCGLFLFSLVGFFITKRIYSPIRKITELFTNSKFGIQNINMGEFAVISKVFNETLHRYQTLEYKSLNKNLLLKENFLRDLLKSESIIDDYEFTLKEYNINIEFSSMILVAAKIDKFSQIDISKRAAYESTLCKIIPDILNEDFICETVNMYDGEIALLLNYKNTNSNNFDILLTNMDKLKDLSKKTLQITLTIGIGGVTSHIGECCQAYAIAEEMIKYRFTLGFDRCIYKRYLEENLSTNIYFPIEIEYNLISSLKLSKKELFIESVQQIIDLIKNYPYSDAVYIFFQIIFTCIKTINQTFHQDNSRFHLTFDKFNNIFVELQTLDQSVDWLNKTYDEYQKMLSDINQLKNSKHYKTVEEIQNYIKEHYQEINLSVESIAEITGYTPYYFSKIFKDITGFNINDYIRQIRIDKAKELLTTSNCKVNEIPEMLGFTSASHFFSAFKKDVGLTPVAYREYVLSKMQNH